MRVQGKLQAELLKLNGDCCQRFLGEALLVKGKGRCHHGKVFNLNFPKQGPFFGIITSVSTNANFVQSKAGSSLRIGWWQTLLIHKHLPSCRGIDVI